MSLRGTTWAFIVISVLIVIALKYTLMRVSKQSLKHILPLMLIVTLLAAGKFSQYSLLISDSSITPAVTYPQYTAALWLKDNTIHGSSLLVAPFEVDNKAFEASRNMAPYAYLKEYFINDEKGRTYEKFSGYIPFVGEFFDQYKGSPNIQIIYSNGKIQIGYNN